MLYTEPDALHMESLRIFRISRFHGSISHSGGDHRVGRSAYDNTKDFSLKIIAMTFSYFLSLSLRSKLTSCRFPGISEQNVQNAVAASQHRTGWGGRESSCFIWRALPATSAAGNYQQVNNSLCWTTGFYANRIIWRMSMVERRQATVNYNFLIWIFIHCNLTSFFFFLDGCEGDGYHKNKAKRVRTTFTEEQLQVLQANFQLDSNPDGQDLERIASVTGLSKRVTQVWFQNSRARQKKHIHAGKSKRRFFHLEKPIFFIILLFPRIRSLKFS